MRFISALWLLWGLAVGFPALAQADDACDMPADLLTPSSAMPHVAQALKQGKISIFAVGSGSTVGETGGANGPALNYKTPGASFPFRMAEALRASRPGLQVNLTVKGGRSLTAGAMLPMLRDALKHAHFDLVIWQTGTVEAVHGMRPDELRSDLIDGAALVDEAAADLVLVDAQFSRFLRANADLSPYQATLRQVSGLDGVTLFPRFELTQTWVTAGQVDLERVSPEARDQTVMQLNTCLGRALAQYLLAGPAQN